MLKITQEIDKIIEQIFVQMKQFSGEGSAIFYQVNMIKETPYFGDISISKDSSDDLKTFIKKISNTQMLSGTATALSNPPSWRKKSWDVYKPTPLMFNKFSLFDQDINRKDAYNSNIWKNVYIPFEVEDQLRALVFDGPKLVGWLGIWRHGKNARFSLDEHAKLNQHSQSILRSARLIDSLRDEDLSQNKLFAICDDKGHFEYSSEALRGWLSKSHMKIISEHLVKFKQDQSLAHGIAIAGIILRPVKIFEQNKWILIPGPRSALMLQPTRILSDKQLEIAHLLSIGLTEKEVSHYLDMDINTVKFYRKSIFKALNILNKNELSKILLM